MCLLHLLRSKIMRGKVSDVLVSNIASRYNVPVAKIPGSSGDASLVG